MLLLLCLAYEEDSNLACLFRCYEDEKREKKEKAYPKAHWERSGRVLVNKVAPKIKNMKDIAEKIKEMRGRA